MESNIVERRKNAAPVPEKAVEKCGNVTRIAFWGSRREKGTKRREGHFFQDRRREKSVRSLSSPLGRDRDLRTTWETTARKKYKGTGLFISDISFCGRLCYNDRRVKKRGGGEANLEITVFFALFGRSSEIIIKCSRAEQKIPLKEKIRAARFRLFSILFKGEKGK